MDRSIESSFPRLLRLSQIIPTLIDVSKSTIMRWIKKGAFPPPLKNAPRTKLWSESEVRAWMEDRWRSDGGDS
jgi:prophage regulatory protein